MTYLLQSDTSLSLFALFFSIDEVGDVIDAFKARVATAGDDCDQLFESLFER